MKLQLTRNILETLQRELRRAQRREIGGVIVGEHIKDETFKIADISVQRDGGSSAHFVRDPDQHRIFLENFFSRTGCDYDRFNYIGEWHSHPTFSPIPSRTDCETMYNIVDDPDATAGFAVLIVARMHSFWGLQLSATGFRSGILPDTVELEACPGDRHARKFTQLKAQFEQRVRWI